MSNFPSELRYNKLSDRWVLIASGRANRPHDDVRPLPKASRRDDPFDPQRIHEEEITDMIPNDDGSHYSEPSDWKALSIWNAYPLVTPDHGKPKLKGSQISGYGYHEIVVHSPEIDKNFEDFTPEQTRAVFELYLKRYNQSDRPREFELPGVLPVRAGCRLSHPDHAEVTGRAFP